ncbi:hypothetical protein QBC39DRAFT_313958 [Podospora conica]|nr:hypothetical protein QBC39DRAFT_313958 [Schizothecium conicum]
MTSPSPPPWWWSPEVEALAALPPSAWIQSFYLVAAAACLATASLPADARSLLADYGARKSTTTTTTAKQDSVLLALVATLTSWGQVPHSWFTAFYSLSVGCSVFWAWQLLGEGAVLRGVAERQAAAGGQPSASRGQTAAVWAMVLLQAGRRVYEHAAVMRASRSTMWFVHWVLGLGFYLALSVAVWVEGSGAILGARTAAGGWKVAVAVPVFVFAWVNQHRCHKHLAGLKKYSLPSDGLFRHLVCPHYACECLLYFSLAVAGAPEGRWVNRTLLCATAFAVVNLGVTAAGTRRWYADKFGQEAVAKKWNMIPFVF